MTNSDHLQLAQLEIQADPSPLGPSTSTAEASRESPHTPLHPMLVEVNSGGTVLFCFFATPTPQGLPSTPDADPNANPNQGWPFGRGQEEGSPGRTHCGEGSPEGCTPGGVAAKLEGLLVGEGGGDGGVGFLVRPVPADGGGTDVLLENISPGGGESFLVRQTASGNDITITGIASEDTASVSAAAEAAAAAAGTAVGGGMEGVVLGARGVGGRESGAGWASRLSEGSGGSGRGLAAPEGCLILKSMPSRLLVQSEQFANELTRHLDICAPTCRILRQQVSVSVLEDFGAWSVVVGVGRWGGGWGVQSLLLPIQCQSGTWKNIKLRRFRPLPSCSLEHRRRSCLVSCRGRPVGSGRKLPQLLRH